jgi:hypothetical protein
VTPLQELLEALDRTTGPGCSPIWVQAYGRPGVDRVLATDRVMDRMFGWRPPAPCWAVGVVADGRAWAVDAGPAGTPPALVRTRVFVSSAGEVVSRVRFADGRVTEEVPRYGRTLDALRRCLDLATEPPARPAMELIALVWMAEIAVAATGDRRRRRPLGWAEVAAMHPAARALAEDGHPVDPDHLDQAIAAAGRAWTWGRLRDMAASGDGWLSDLVPPHLAAWMDDGMFSRWFFYGPDPWAPFVDVVRRDLEPDVARRVRRCLEGSGTPIGR